MKSNYGLAMDQEANTRGTESMRGDLEGIERILSDGMSRAGRENGTLELFQRPRQDTQLKMSDPDPDN